MWLFDFELGRYGPLQSSYLLLYLVKLDLPDNFFQERVRNVTFTVYTKNLRNLSKIYSRLMLSLKSLNRI